MPTIHSEGFRFNGKLYKTVEEFRAAMIEAARARPELHPEGRPVDQPEDTPKNLVDPGPFAGRRSRDGFFDPKAVKAFEDRVRDNQGRETC